MGKPYDEYNAQYVRLKRAQEAEEARFTDFNQGENYFNRQPDPQMQQPSGYQLQQDKKEKEEQEKAYAPTNRNDNKRVVKKAANNDSDDNDWGDDDDDDLPE